MPDKVLDGPGSIPRGSEDEIFTPLCPDRSWGLHSRLQNNYYNFLMGEVGEAKPGFENDSDVGKAME